MTGLRPIDLAKPSAMAARDQVDRDSGKILRAPVPRHGLAVSSPWPHEALALNGVSHFVDILRVSVAMFPRSHNPCVTLSSRPGALPPTRPNDAPHVQAG